MKDRTMRKSYIFALILALGLGAWLFSGQFDREGDKASSATAIPELGNEAGAKAEGVTKSGPGPVPVRVRMIAPRPMMRELVVNGRTEAKRVVEIKAETSGRIVSVPVAQGRAVAAGDLIAEIDMRERKARLTEARARLEQRKIEYDAALTLSKKGFRAETNLAAAKASLEEARAELKEIEVDVDNTSIRAPFAGVLETRYVETGDFVSAGTTVARVIERDPFLVVGDVTERDVAKVTLGMKAHAQLVTGQSVEGTVTFVSAEAHPVTRTFRVEVEVDNTTYALPVGVTTELRLPTKPETAVLASPALLSLDEDGRMGVKLVDGDDRVVFQQVDVLSATAQGVWLTGLPEGGRLITVGSGFVEAGDQVTAVPEQEVEGGISTTGSPEARS